MEAPPYVYADNHYFCAFQRPSSSYYIEKLPPT